MRTSSAEKDGEVTSLQRNETTRDSLDRAKESR